MNLCSLSPQLPKDEYPLHYSFSLAITSSHIVLKADTYSITFHFDCGEGMGKFWENGNEIIRMG